MNIPDVISEPMGCRCLNFLWNRGNEVGDATNPRTGEKIEFKATSRFEGDLSSFGPACEFDDLIFLRFNLDKNLLYIYDLNINSKQLGELPANQTTLVKEQQAQGRRPRISIYNLLIKGNDEHPEREPDIIFDIRKCKIIVDNRGK